MATEGWRGLFVGFGTIALRDMPFMVILFTTYEHLRAIGDHPVLMTLFGGVSGALAGFATTPFDVARTRVLLPVHDVAAENAVANNIKMPAKTIINQQVAPAQKSTNVVKEKRQVALMSHASSPSLGKTPSTVSLFTSIYRQQGISGLFVGGFSRSAWWFGVCSIFFPSYETILTLLED
jgi:hypothetical protein